MKMKLSNLRFF